MIKMETTSELTSPQLQLLRNRAELIPQEAISFDFLYQMINNFTSPLEALDLLKCTNIYYNNNAIFIADKMQTMYTKITYLIQGANGENFKTANGFALHHHLTKLCANGRGAAIEYSAYAYYQLASTMLVYHKYSDALMYASIAFGKGMNTAIKIISKAQLVLEAKTDELSQFMPISEYIHIHTDFRSILHNKLSESEKKKIIDYMDKMGDNHAKVRDSYLTKRKAPEAPTLPIVTPNPKKLKKSE
jgi:hypothetical protein